MHLPRGHLFSTTVCRFSRALPPYIDIDPATVATVSIFTAHEMAVPADEVRRRHFIGGRDGKERRRRLCRVAVFRSGDRSVRPRPAIANTYFSEFWERVNAAGTPLRAAYKVMS